MRVLLIFRNKNKGGKSIEGIFSNLILYTQKGLQISSWEMPSVSSFFSRIYALRKTSADVYHVTGDINYAALFLWDRRVILTIHDIGRYKELKGIWKWVYGLVWIKWPCMAASKVTTVSKFTANEILTFFPSIPADKIEVIHNGYDPIYKPVAKEFNTTCPIILQVGTAIHKNVQTVIAAAALFSCKLIIIGSLSNDLKRSLEQAQINYRAYSELNQEELRIKYEESDIVVFISTHEGFGMPVIEAQAVGRPVISSRLTALPEVGGKGVYYMDNHLDANELAERIRNLMENDNLRQQLILLGFENAQRFSWNTMSQTYLKLYAKVAEV